MICTHVRRKLCAAQSIKIGNISDAGSGYNLRSVRVKNHTLVKLSVVLSVALWALVPIDALAQKGGFSKVIKGEKVNVDAARIQAALTRANSRPDSAQAQYELAKLYISAHEYDKALVLLEKAERLDARNSAYVVQKACIALAQDNDEQVKRYVEAAIKLPDISEVDYASMLDLLDNIEERSLAYRVSKQARERYPKSIWVRYQSAIAARYDLKNEEAIKLFERCKGFKPLGAGPEVQITEIHYELKNWPAVIEDMKAFCGPNEKRADINQFRLPDLLRKGSEAFYQTGRYSQALPLISRAIVISPMQAELHKFRATVYRKLNNTAAALADDAAVKKIHNGLFRDL